MVQNNAEYDNVYVDGQAFRLSKNKVITTAMIDDINYEFDHVWADAGLRVVDTNYLRYEEGDWLHHTMTHLNMLISMVNIWIDR